MAVKSRNEIFAYIKAAQLELAEAGYMLGEVKLCTEGCGMALDNLLAAIALEAAYQLVTQRGARWSRRKFFGRRKFFLVVGERIVREMRPLKRSRSCKMPTDKKHDGDLVHGFDGDVIKVSPRVLKAWLEVQQRQAALRADLAAVGDFLNRGGRGRALEFRLLAILLTSNLLHQDLFKCVLDLVHDDQECQEK